MSEETSFISGMMAGDVGTIYRLAMRQNGTFSIIIDQSALPLLDTLELNEPFVARRFSTPTECEIAIDFTTVKKARLAQRENRVKEVGRVIADILGELSLAQPSKRSDSQIGHFDLGPMWGMTFSRAAARYLYDKPSSHRLDSAWGAMVVALTNLWPYRTERGFSIREIARGVQAIYLNHGVLLHADTQGCACLGPTGQSYDGPDFGFRLAPHNVDTPVQQLILLAGVAGLWDEMYRALYRKGEEE